GVLSRGGGADALALRARAERAFDGLGSFEVVQHGPLIVGWTNGIDERPVESGDWLCVLDGAIYNLPAALAEAGFDVVQPVGEAALAAAYARHGESLLGRLRGDFVLLLWDRRAQAGLLARDQLGCGSLAWSEGPD